MKKYLSAFCIATLSLSIASCHHKDKDAHAEMTPEIDVAEAFTDSIVLHKTYPGYLASAANAAVVCQIDGMYLQKHYDAGTYVKKGQLLFTIDPTLYRDAVAQSQANLASAISQRDYAKSHYEAVKKAAEADAVSKMEVLQAQSAWEQAESSIKSAQAGLRTAQTNLGYCSITAPISGYITDATYSIGNFIHGAGNPVVMCNIYDNTTLSAVFEIEDAQYERMVGRTSGVNDKLYQKMPLQFRDSLLHTYYASLSYEDPAVQQNTGTILLKGHIVNIDNELKDGMYVTISLPYGENPKAVMIKDASIGTDQLGSYVYLVNDSNKVVYTPITVGEVYHDSLRVVEKGVKPGDRYVTKALLTVRDGETVKPILKK